MLQSPNRTIQPGDTVIAYVGYDDLRPIVVNPSQQFQCSIGRFNHCDFIGKKYGTRVDGKANERNNPIVPQLLLLPCTPELWTKAVLHRTQIIYATDIAQIVTGLRLRPGAKIAEAGTGSGSLTHSLARAVAPTGCVYTFDFHKGRAVDAKEEFARHGISDIVKSGWADVCTTGFDVRKANGEEGVEVPAIPARIEDMTEAQVGYCLPKGEVDAVFLDVPAPWAALENIVHVLNHNGMLCSFSPCIEQTQRLCDAVRATELFVDLRTVEVLARDYVPVFRTEGERPIVGSKRKHEEGGEKEENNLNGAEKEEDQQQPPATSAAGSRVPLHFKPVHMMKSHTAFLTFARRKLAPTPLALENAKKEEEEEGERENE